MLKYVAIIVVLIGGYFYMGQSKSEVPKTLPQLPKTRSQALKIVKPPVASVAVQPTRTPPPTSEQRSLPTEKKYTYPEVQKLIASDDVCALKKLMHEITTKGEAPIYIDALFEALNLDSFKDIFGIEGPLFKAQDGKSLSPAQKFADALASADFFSNTKREIQDGEKSLKTLEELVSAFPDNAAYAMYKLALEHQMGKTNAHMRSTLAQISKAKQYDSQVGGLKSALIKHLWDSPTIYFLANSVMGELPHLRSHKLRDAFAQVEDQKVIEHAGSLLVEKGLNSKRTLYSGEFDTAEYYYGNTFLNNKHPDLRELSESKEPGKLQEIEDNYLHYELNIDDCDRTAFDEHFSKLKNRY